LLVLRRSPLLLAILVAYPLAIAVLVGLVASYGSSKPGVPLVDEDNLPVYDLSPWPEAPRATLWLLVLGGIFGVLARVEARRLSA
jgi:hypothetical protein